MHILQTMLQDLTFALRQLRRTPGFALTAVLTLALGIGANTAIFSLLDQALLRSLPVHDPSSLVVLQGTGKAWNGSSRNYGGDAESYFSYPMYRDLRDRSQAFAGLIATSPATVGFAHDGAGSLPVNSEVVSGNYFTVLGVLPALGRTLTQADDAAPGANPVAVLSYDFWRTRMAANPSVVGSTVLLNGHPFQIIGVAAPGFQSAVWGQTPALFTPMAMLEQVEPGSGSVLTLRTTKWMNIIGRLQPGESAAQAQAALAPLWHALRADELKQMGSRSPRFVRSYLTESRLNLLPGARGFSYNRDQLRNPFLAVMGMALLVLLISAVNVASLLLVRSASRVREFSLRAALGARNGRVLSQLLLEGLVIGVFGGACGLLLAPPAMHLLVSRLSDPDNGTAFSSALDLRVLAFNFVVAVAVSLLFSLAPALQLRRLNLTSTLRESTSTGSGSLLTLRRFVVCLQLGLSVILLAGAGLFLRSMQRLRAVDVGFNTTHLVTFGVDPQLAGYTLANSPALHQRIFTALAEIPGVQSVMATNDTELANNTGYANVSVAGYVTPPDDSFQVEIPVVTASYFSTLNVPILAGRGFTETDDLTHPLVAVVNQSFARHFCGSVQACLGRRIATGSTLKLDTEIIGVARDAIHSNVRDKAEATMFRPLRQQPDTTQLQVYLRTVGEPTAMLASVRRAMHQLDPALAVGGLLTMDQQIDANLQNERMIALLAVAFGALATVLAGVGLYGVLAFSTAQRTREIGIRMALGSTRLAVSSLILGDVLKLAALGILLAIPVALALGRTLRAQLYGVSAADPVILLSVVGLTAGVALLAALIPARRAASVNPTVALRTE